MTDYYVRFLALVDEIERTYPVTRWQVGEVPVWPLARNELYVDLYWQDYGPSVMNTDTARQRRLSTHLQSVLSRAATPLTNTWRSRADLRNMLLFPRSARALFFGDEFALEWIDGAWRDRFFHPLITQLHQKGCSTLIMQRGSLQQQPRSSPVLAANTIENWGPLFAAGLGLSKRLTSAFPDHNSVVKFLEHRGAPTRALAPGLLRKKAAAVVATAYGFEQVLKIVRPSICFMMTLGFGQALALACRRQGILSVEVQRSGIGSRILEYCWSALPENGYTVLPAVFWTWTGEEASAVRTWSDNLKLPWHRSICGGIRNWVRGSMITIRRPRNSMPGSLSCARLILPGSKS